MKIHLLTLVLLVLIGSGAVYGEETGCPKGTIPNGEKTPDSSEAWCELESNRSQFHGPYRSWYANKVLGTVENYDHGKRAGKAKYYWENGKDQATGQYKSGVRDGIWKFTDKDGADAGNVEYRDGKIVFGHEPKWAIE